MCGSNQKPSPSKDDGISQNIPKEKAYKTTQNK